MGRRNGKRRFPLPALRPLPLQGHHSLATATASEGIVLARYLFGGFSTETPCPGGGHYARNARAICLPVAEPDWGLA